VAVYNVFNKFTHVIVDTGQHYDYEMDLINLLFQSRTTFLALVADLMAVGWRND